MKGFYFFLKWRHWMMDTCWHLVVNNWYVIELTTLMETSIFSLIKNWRIYFFLTSTDTEMKGLYSFIKWRHRIDYHTRANKGCSWLVAAPMRFHAKTHFLSVYYVTIWGQKQKFWFVGSSFIGAGTVINFSNNTW